MVFFITVLRALACVLITNAHYTGIYPSDIIANGGLVGDVLFFAVSGYCLYNPKTNFKNWYAKRLWRIYVPVLIGTIVYLILGFYNFEQYDWKWWLIYPTYYHFVASIIILYIPYYFVVTVDFLKKNILKLMVIIFIIAIAVYIFIYDKSYYHIDVVREPFIRFLFFESMLLGAYYKSKPERKDSNKIWFDIVIAFISFGMYIVSKIVFSRIDTISYLQFFNQIAIFILLIMIFKIAKASDDKLNSIPNICKKIINFLANITLEIYIVQYVIIEQLRNVGGFPINWIVVTISIVMMAVLLHHISKVVYAIPLSFKKGK